MDATKVAALEQRYGQMKEARSRAEGVVEQLTTQLKTEFNLNSVEEADEMITQLSEKIRMTNAKADELGSDLGRELTAAGY